MFQSYNSLLSGILSSEPADVLIYPRITPKNKETYERFDQDFATYLSKLPNNNVKKYVSEVFDRKIIHIGQNQLSKGVNLNFARVIFNDKETADKLKRIVLDAKEFGIKMPSGECDNIDECIYASYFAFIRCAVVQNRTDIKKNEKLQNLLAQYLYQIFISLIDTSNIDTAKQKFFIKFLAYYIFYRHFIRETYASAVKIVTKNFPDDKDFINELLPVLKEVSKYESVKDFPKILIDTHTISTDPNLFSINLLKKYKQHAFYCVYGSLDMFIAFTVITKYPFELFVNTPTVNTSVQKEVEEIMIPYMRKVTFS